MAREYRMAHVQGDQQLVQVMKEMETDGFELLQVIWTGNIQPPGPQGIIGPAGQQTKIPLIHLYLVIFSRRPMMNEFGVKADA